MEYIKKIQIYLFVFYFNILICGGIFEIPLQPIKVKGIPKYSNLTIIEPETKAILNNSITFHEEGDTVINFEYLFLVNVKIGSNSQSFNMLLDTGSSIFWVARKGCIGKNNIINRFDPSASTSSISTGQSFEMSYGTGYCRGTLYNDNVQYISDKKFNIFFGVATYADFRVTGADGIIGLTKSYDSEELSFIHMLKKSGITDSLAFSIKFEDDYFKSGVKGTMYIGEHDDFSKDEVKSCPLVFYTNKIFWACQLTSFGLKGSTYETKSNQNTPIIFDTGTNVIILPTRFLADIKDDLKNFGCYIQQNKDYSIYCTNSGDLPDLRFDFNGIILEIPKEYAFSRKDENSNVLISFVIFDDSMMAIMGSVFFFLFHTLFDEEKQEIKFYPLKGKGLSTFVIILICITSVAIVVLITFTICYCIKKRKSDNNTQQYQYKESWL